MKILAVTLSFFVCYFLILKSIEAQPFEAKWASIDNRPIPTWFEDAKFGIFIHWGVYSVPAYSPTARDKVGIYDRYAEHYWRRWQDPNSTQKYFTDFHNRTFGPQIRYQDFAQWFKAELFHPEEWAKLFENAGAKYIILTSKHHEGFTLWPSKHSWNWNAGDVGPHRDLLGDLTKAIRDRNLKMGYYYSLLEWYHPLYKKESINQYVDEHMIPQMKDLVTTYRPDVFWTDGEWHYNSEVFKSTEFLAWLYNDSPVRDYVVVNDRWGKDTRSKHGGFFTTEYDLIHDGDTQGVKFERPWEECRGIAGSFGYNRNEMLEDYSTSEELIHILINKVARGGNLLLNVGPTADGRIPVIMQQRLADIGNWLKVNGEGIYGTRKWEKAPKIEKTTTTYFTRKGKDLYLLATKWQSTFTIEDLSSNAKVSLLGYKGPVKSSFKTGKLTIKAPLVSPATIPCSFAWVYKIERVL